jgi:predicted  nucleic acid-binding Zn-ribbon protein
MFRKSTASPLASPVAILASPIATARRLQSAQDRIARLRAEHNATHDRLIAAIRQSGEEARDRIRLEGDLADATLRADHIAETARLRAEADAQRISALRDRVDQLEISESALASERETLLERIAGLEARDAAVASDIAGLTRHAEYGAQLAVDLQSRVTELLGIIDKQAAVIDTQATTIDRLRGGSGK